MSSYNKVTILGNLGLDPESRPVSSGNMPIVNLSVATTEKRRGQDETTWHRVVVFDKQAENCAKYLQKGSKVLVDGRISKSKYTDKNGIERISCDIIANRVLFLTSKNSKQPQQQLKPITPEVLDDNIPF